MRNALQAVVNHFDLIDPAIKVYPTIFFLFFMHKPSIAAQAIIDRIQKNIALFGSWHEEHVLTGVDDL
ncbi:MAG: hypothetical protein KJ709_07240 [Nanoarchaeota archaeon]|nr:hypothetical protein [Nanoarchaeota archaeon]